MRKSTILVTGGGTGGHLTPAIAICEILDSGGYNPVLLTDSRCERYVSKDFKHQLEVLDLMRPGGIRNLFKFLYNLKSCVTRSIKLIRESDAKLVIACGGYSSAPLLIAAIWTFTPIALQEQNAVLGRANYLFSHFAKRLFTSFAHTVGLPLLATKKIIWTPILTMKKHENQERKKRASISGILSNDIKILVTGGSQGAAIFDDIVPDAVIALAKELPGKKFTVFQQSKNNAKTKDKYLASGINCEIREFFDDLENYYSQADFFIGRSGAGTMNEVIYHALPAIFIPYPSAAHDHQYHNAKFLAEFGAATILLQKDITIDLLKGEIISLLSSYKSRLEAIQGLSHLKHDSGKIILDQVKILVDKAS